MKITKQRIWTYLISVLVFIFLGGTLISLFHFDEALGMILSGFLVTSGLIIFYKIEDE